MDGPLRRAGSRQITETATRRMQFMLAIADDERPIDFPESIVLVLPSVPAFVNKAASPA
jgi:hypothetical protein